MAVGSEGETLSPVMLALGAAECCRATGTTEEKLRLRKVVHSHVVVMSWQNSFGSRAMLLSLDWFPLLGARHVSAPLRLALESPLFAGITRGKCALACKTAICPDI